MNKSITTIVIALSFGLLLFTVPSHSQTPAVARVQTIEQRTAAMQKIDAFFPLYWGEAAGTLWLEIPRFDSEVLYITGIAAGLGSNDIGLDRGESGGGRIGSFQRIGPRVLMVQSNQNFRSSSRNATERRSVEDSFAKSV